jgi:hypothetical protein
MRWIKQTKRGFAVYRPYRRSDYIGNLLAFVIVTIISFILLDSYLLAGICIVLSTLVLFLVLKPTAFSVNCHKGVVINEFLKSYPIADLEIIEKKAIIKNLLINLSHLSDEEMEYIKEQIPNNFMPDGTSPEAVYINHLIMRVIESKEEVKIGRGNIVSIPEHDIDDASISFDDIKAHCKNIMSHCNPMHVVWKKEPQQEALIQFEIEEDNIYLSVVTEQGHPIDGKNAAVEG